MNLSPSDMDLTDKPLHEPEMLLDWMTHHHLPLQIMREDPSFGEWVVVDASDNSVKGSGPTVLDALCAAYENQ